MTEGPRLDWTLVNRFLHHLRRLRKMSTSTDGGLTWAAAQETANQATGLSGQPVVQPGETVVVPLDNSNFTSILAFRSTDGGATWSSAQTVSSIKDHTEAASLRSQPMPSAEIDGAGRVFGVWQDCRFRRACRSTCPSHPRQCRSGSTCARPRSPLDRGYAASRFSWPIDFGLFNSKNSRNANSVLRSEGDGPLEQGVGFGERWLGSQPGEDFPGLSERPCGFRCQALGDQAPAPAEQSEGLLRDDPEALPSLGGFRVEPGRLVGQAPGLRQDGARDAQSMLPERVGRLEP